MNKQSTSTILKSLRESRGYSQQQVAELLNVERTTYVKYESGAINPTRKLTDIAKLYNVSVDFLLGGDTSPNNTFNLQLFRNPNASEANVAMAFGKILTLKDEQAKQLTLQIVEDVIQLTIPQLEALSALIKTIK